MLFLLGNVWVKKYFINQKLFVLIVFIMYRTNIGADSNPQVILLWSWVIVSQYQ